MEVSDTTPFVLLYCTVQGICGLESMMHDKLDRRYCSCLHNGMCFEDHWGDVS